MLIAPNELHSTSQPLEGRVSSVPRQARIQRALDVVVGAAGQHLCNLGPLVGVLPVQRQQEQVLVARPGVVVDARIQVVAPPATSSSSVIQQSSLLSLHDSRSDAPSAGPVHLLPARASLLAGQRELTHAVAVLHHMSPASVLEAALADRREVGDKVFLHFAG